MSGSSDHMAGPANGSGLAASYTDLHYRLPGTVSFGGGLGLSERHLASASFCLFDSSFVRGIQVDREGMKGSSRSRAGVGILYSTGLVMVLGSFLLLLAVVWSLVERELPGESSVGAVVFFVIWLLAIMLCGVLSMGVARRESKKEEGCGDDEHD